MPNKRGRPRKYPNGAAKALAYRNRRKAQLDTLKAEYLVALNHGEKIRMEILTTKIFDSLHLFDSNLSDKVKKRNLAKFDSLCKGRPSEKLSSVEPPELEPLYEYISFEWFWKLDKVWTFWSMVTSDNRNETS